MRWAIYPQLMPGWQRHLAIPAFWDDSFRDLGPLYFTQGPPHHPGSSMLKDSGANKRDILLTAACMGSQGRE